MAYNEALAGRVRRVLSGRKGITERKMFGGLAFMLSGNMCCGVLGDDLIVRVGPARYDEAMKRPHTRPFDLTGRVMRGMVVVGPGGTDRGLGGWVRLGIEFAGTLPEKNK